jgi:hypothetical protein
VTTQLQFIIIIIVIVISFMQGIYTYIPETNHIPKEYNVAAILSQCCSYSVAMLQLFCRNVAAILFLFLLLLSSLLLLLLLFLTVNHNIILFC